MAIAPEVGAGTLLALCEEYPPDRQEWRWSRSGGAVGPGTSSASIKTSDEPREPPEAGAADARRERSWISGHSPAPNTASITTRQVLESAPCSMSPTTPTTGMAVLCGTTDDPADARSRWPRLDARPRHDAR
jgi:hypothetical protein